MTPEIIARNEFIVVGVRAVMEMGAETTGFVWKEKFLPRHSEIAGADRRYYGVFNMLPDDQAGGRVEYVAGVAASLENIPIGMVGWVIPEGNYAEATAIGLSSVAQVCRLIIADWLPDSGYQLMCSPMFAYTDNPHPDSAEAIWKINVPVETPEALAQLEKWLV